MGVQQHFIGTVRKFIERYTLKMFNMRPVQDSVVDKHKLVLLNPDLVCKFSDMSDVTESLAKLEITQKNFVIHKFDLTFNNWSPHDILKAILPDGEEGVSGFSIIGHIIHLNLKAHHEPFKSVIGQALLLTKNIKTVVNKSQNIDNTYRNFAMELLAGEDNFLVSVKENNCSFDFDFSKVYWNPRLSSEHERIVNLLNSSSLLLDACAGVGPFSIPAGKKCQVMANDLNPESYKWLTVNCDKNKSSSKNVQCFNLDARVFIRTEVKDKLTKIWSNEDSSSVTNIHITMNLPALAITFLDVFQGLFSDCQHLKDSAKPLPKVHVYGFSKEEDQKQDIKERCEKYLGCPLDENHLEDVFFVRNVAPKKDMMRASFLVPIRVLFDLPVISLNDSYEDTQNCNGMKRDRSPDLINSSNKR